MHSEFERGQSLQAHTLADGVLPFAPRKPFAHFSQKALAAAAQITSSCPEKRGILSHIVRQQSEDIPPATRPKISLEAHFDAVQVPTDLGNLLLEAGFEPDGFKQFVPAHFTDHFTLKFTIDAHDAARVRALRAEMQQRASLLISAIARQWPDVEAYLEMEMYSDAMRRRWPHAPVHPGWKANLPYAPGAFSLVVPPCNADEARERGLPIKLIKRADLHMKIDSEVFALERIALMDRLAKIGFYPVITWAGNNIFTAQFAKPGHARKCFNLFDTFFTRFGGCREMTMETISSVWRSQGTNGRETRLAALPPLVVSIAKPA